MLLKGAGGSGVTPSFLQLGLSSEEDEEFKSDIPVVDNKSADDGILYY